MKKIIYKFMQSRNEGKALHRNGVLSDHNDNRIVIVLLAAMVPKTIRGKLGFKEETSDEKFLFNSKAIFNALTADLNALYSPAFAKLALLGTLNDSLQKAMDALRQGGKGLEAKKNKIKKQVYNTLISALAYINDLCRDDQDNASTMITGCTMVLVKETTSKKQDFAVKQGGATEEIDLISLAVKNGPKYLSATYMWQVSIDGGKTWEDLEPTLIAKTTATGMLVGISTLFRKRTKTTEFGMSAWCTPIEIVPQ